MPYEDKIMVASGDSEHPGIEEVGFETIPPRGGGTGGPGIYMGTCTTAADSSSKVANVDSDFKLVKGVIVGIKYSNTNTFSATSGNPVTLNVNGTGAKNIYWNNTANPTGTNVTAFGYSNRVTYYAYDGTYWVFAGHSSDNNQTGARQYPTNTTNADYRVLLSYGANDNDETNLTRKDTNFKYNPSTNNLTVKKINTIPVEDFALESEINDITDIYGAKNLFNTKCHYTLFTNGSSYEDPTFNSDGTIQFGSFSGGNYYGCEFTDNISFNESIDLIFTSGLTDASDSTAYIEVLYNPSSTVESVRIYNEPVLIEDVRMIDQINLVSIDGHSRLFKPMLRTASIKSDKYVPFAMTNKQLTDLVITKEMIYPVGSIIHSTTCDTMAKVVAAYGGTTWIQHKGYFLRGATDPPMVIPNSAIKDGGSDTVTLTGAQSGLKGHGHGFTQPTVNGGATNTGGMSANESHSHKVGQGAGPAGSGWTWLTTNQSNLTNTGSTSVAHTHSQVAHTHSVSGGKVSDAGASDATSSHSVLPNYKNVYIWERTA